MRYASTAIRWLLAAGVLVAGGPVWRHAHPGGDRPHRHAPATHSPATHSPPSHLHAHDHGTHDHGIHGHDGMGNSHAHAHVVLLGVEFTLPIESDDDDSHSGRIAFLVDAPPAVERAEAVAYFDAALQPAADGGRPLPIVPAFRSITAIAAPLCDTARHERSGVQLA